MGGSSCLNSVQFLHSDPSVSSCFVSYGSQGRCYGGRCKTRDRQCQALWGHGESSWGWRTEAGENLELRAKLGLLLVEHALH